MFQLGRFDEGVGEFEQALRIRPELPSAQHNLGQVLDRANRVPEAVEHLKEAVRLDPNDAEFRFDLGNALIHQGNLTDALTQFREAAKLAPNNAAIHGAMGTVFIVAGRPREAVEPLEQALRIDPDMADAQNNLAWVLATLPPSRGGDAVKAVGLAQRACELTGNRLPGTLDTLAAAYAAAGRFGEAVATAEKAIDMAQSAGQTKLAAEIEARLQLYRSGRAYRPPADATTPSNP